MPVELLRRPVSWWQEPTTRSIVAMRRGPTKYNAGPGNGADAMVNGTLTASARLPRPAYFGPIPSHVNQQLQRTHGISFEQSTIRKDDITDGLSQTILVGEKYLAASSYGTGNVGADNENEYVGFDNDTGRTTYRAPMQDRWGLDDPDAFGSAHPNAANFVLCDGSVITDQLCGRSEYFPHARHAQRRPARGYEQSL